MLENGIVTPEVAKNLTLSQIKEIMNARFCNLPEQLKLYMGEDNSKERIITFLENKADELYYYSDYLDDVGEEYLNEQMMFNMVEFELYFDMLNHRRPLEEYDRIAEYGKKAAGFLEVTEKCYEHIFNSMMDVVDVSLSYEEMQRADVLAYDFIEFLCLLDKDMKPLDKKIVFDFNDALPKFSFAFDNEALANNHKEVKAILECYCRYAMAVGGNLLGLVEIEGLDYAFSFEVKKRDFRGVPASEIAPEIRKNFKYMTLDELLNDENFFLSRSV
jgi:hypothetical protein